MARTNITVKKSSATPPSAVAQVSGAQATLEVGTMARIAASRRVPTGVVASSALGALSIPDASSSSPLIQGLTLEDFESGMRLVQPGEDADALWFWNNGDLGGGSNSGNASISSAQAFEGTHSLRGQQTGGDYFQLYCNTAVFGVSGWSNTTKWTKRFVENPNMVFNGHTWTDQTYNRMRFWIKLPNGYTQNRNGSNNFQWANFHKSAESNYTSDDGGNHWYHFFDLGTHDSRWQHVIIDWHPQHKRGASGSTEHGEKQSLYAGKWYFDNLASWYFDIPYDAVVGDHFFDGVEFYADPNNEDVNNITGLNGVYVPSTNLINVGWGHRKNEVPTYDIKYAWSSIHAMGWASATAAPNSPVTGHGNSDVTLMDWQSTGIDVSGHTWIFIGVKRTTMSTFREIAIPLT